MSSLPEVLVTSDTNNSLWSHAIWDPYNGTNLMTYKGGGTAETKTLSFIKNDYIASVESNKPVLCIWPLNSQQPVQGIRFILPGKATAFSVSPDGNYCVAGIEEKIYVWQIASGKVLAITKRHYQKVCILKFTSDSQHFVSAAEDGMVMVWSLPTVTAHPDVELITQKVAGYHDPVYIFSDHTLPVKDLCISKTGMFGRLCTVSCDKTCKIYDLSNGEMLLNLVFDTALSSIAMDIMELHIFIGNIEGVIHKFSLSHPPRKRDILMNDLENLCPVFNSHSNAVTCLSVSLSGDILMSGSADEQVILWHIKSMQPILTVKHKGSITNACFIQNMPSIYEKDFNPNTVLHSLERTMEEDTEDILEVEVMVKNKIDFWPDDLHNNSSSHYSENIESEFQQKELELRKEIEKLKKINSQLYAFNVQNTLGPVLNNTTNNINNHTKKNKKKRKHN